jgi:glycosyltransferase involved in cell wall biosynthesis
MSLVRPISPLPDCAAVFELAQLFRRIRPHVVHTHTSKAGILGRIAARLARAPVRLHTVHGWSFNDFQPAPLRRLFIELERFAAHLSTRLITVCQADMEKGLHLGIGARGQYEVIRWGVRTSDWNLPAGRNTVSRYMETLCPVSARLVWGGIFMPGAFERKRLARQQLGLHPDRPTVGWIGPMKTQKAPLDFVRVAADLASTGSDAQFFMSGDGVLRRRVEHFAKSLGIRSRLSLLGWQYDVPALMSAMDVLVQTSLWEGLPLTLMEAAASGVPFIATDVGGNRELVEEGLAGVTMPLGTLHGLAEEVRKILTLSSEHKAHLAAKTRAQAERICSLPAALGKTARLYETAWKAHR